MARFCQNDLYKTPAIPLLSQFIQYLQQGLNDVDESLLKYISLVTTLARSRFKVS
jgi:hypothetical protein